MHTESIIVHLAECLAERRRPESERQRPGTLRRLVMTLRNLVAV